jgi:hypothetical protein
VISKHGRRRIFNFLAKPVLTLSFLFWGLVCLTLVLFPSRGGVLAAFILYGLHKGAIEPV